MKRPRASARSACGVGPSYNRRSLLPSGDIWVTTPGPEQLVAQAADTRTAVTPERFLDVLAPSGMTQGPTWVEGAIASRESLLAPWRFRPGLWTLRHYGR